MGDARGEGLCLTTADGHYGLYIRLEVDTIYHMVSQRRIPFVKVGRRTMFDVQLLDDWLDRHTVLPTPRKVA